ncbi:MAG: methyltransferase domain-containing protein [Candidatus Magasanikbacteria bacterium]
MSHAGRALIDPFSIFTKIGLTKGMKVADMGCGRTGHFVFPAARIVGETGIVYAVDILKDVLESISSWVRTQALSNVQVIWSDIEMVNKTPIPPKSLDMCFFMNVLCGLKNKPGALLEASRLLKDDGQIVIVDWSKRLGTLGPSDDAIVDPKKLTETADECGLKLVKEILVSDYHYCLIFKKI